MLIYHVLSGVSVVTPGKCTWQAAETVETWEAILEGLASLCEGLSHLESNDESGRPMLLTEAHLKSLLTLATTSSARSAVLRMAASLPESAASASLQSMWVFCASHSLLCSILRVMTFNPKNKRLTSLL